MITVQLSGTALTVRGHAGFSRYGSDIVCAAASMLAFTLAAAMEEAGLQRTPEIESACGSFRIAVRPREGERARVEAVFAAIGAGYRLLAARYPEYVRVMDEDSPENSRQRPEDGPEDGQKEEKDGETGMAAGVRRAGAAAHQHAQQHVDLSQTALHMTGDTFTEIHHFLTDTAKVHDGAGHDEKRNGQHGEGLGGVHDLLEDEPALGTGVKNQEIEEGSAEQRINYRKPQEIKDKHQDNGNDINECQSHQ